MEDFRAALALDSDFMQARTNLGEALVRSGDVAGGGAEFDAVLRKDPDTCGPSRASRCRWRRRRRGRRRGLSPEGCRSRAGRPALPRQGRQDPRRQGAPRRCNPAPAALAGARPRLSPRIRLSRQHLSRPKRLRSAPSRSTGTPPTMRPRTRMRRLRTGAFSRSCIAGTTLWRAIAGRPLSRRLKAATGSNSAAA